MTYDEAVLSLMTLNQVPQNSEDSNFTRLIPVMFAYAEGRIARELNFLATDINIPLQLAAFTRGILLPIEVIHVRALKVCTPAGPITNNSRRHDLERISPEALDMFYPQGSVRMSLPKKFAIIGSRPPSVIPLAQPQPPVPVPEVFQHAVRFGPTPDRAYVAELFGGVMPKPLSPSNPETLISTRYPELLICACMVFVAGAQRDYGAQADDPSRAMSWETQYKYLRDGILLEESMTRGEGSGWTSLPPAQVAQQPRSP